MQPTITRIEPMHQYEGATLYNGDCLEFMAGLPDNSIDLVIADLPYETTDLGWDKAINPIELWKQYRRIGRPRCVYVLFADQPYATDVINAARDLYRYDIVWDKVNRVTGAQIVQYKPLKAHEMIYVFYAQAGAYNPLKLPGKPYVNKRTNAKGFGSHVNEENDRKRTDTINDGFRYPTSIIEAEAAVSEGFLHPTQKPEKLIGRLIEQYSEAGAVVLDNCMGSGTTGAVALKMRRSFIGCEADTEKGYYNKARKRIALAILEGSTHSIAGRR